MSEKINIALLYGSARSGRFCDTIVNWAVGEMESIPDITLDLIDPAVLDYLWPQRAGTKELAVLGQRFAAADAFLIVTPEYNHGYPAALKLLIDAVYGPWQAKPVGFISYGGVSGGLRAVEQLRQVFNELHAVTVRDCVSFAHPWKSFDGTGKLIDTAAARESLDVMLTRLRWWAKALKQARRQVPYDLAAA